MYINVAQLLKERIGSNRSYKIDEPIDDEGKTRVHGNVILIRTDKGILLQGEMTSSVKGTCNRCLSPVDYSINFNLEEEFFPFIDISSGLPLPTTPQSFTIDKDHILDLSDAINQYMILALPMKLLCRQDCAGICPSCGQNLNYSGCNCAAQTHDHRWSKLVHLAKENKI
jgi:uncharacterized protein